MHRPLLRFSTNTLATLKKKSICLPILAGLTRWADQGMHHIAMEMSQFAPGEDVYPLAHAIKEEVMGEINRTIFGPEFQGTLS